ncbi:MAG: small multi-drug export protein [Candidatus Aminicenantaceae bacterium]
MRVKLPAYIGFILLCLEIAFLIFLFAHDKELSLSLLTTVAANHAGGRLAFIAVGLEMGLSSYFIIGFITLHNTMYLLLAYSAFVYSFEHIPRLRLIWNYIHSLRENASRRRKILKKWNWIGIAFFVWIPLPWTGAVIGSYIAHLEGYPPRETLILVAPAMWAGIITWTIWFDILYESLEKIGKGKTIFLTLFLLGVPVGIYIFEWIKRSRRSRK